MERILVAHFTAYASDAVRSGHVSVELNAVCVHTCLPVCSSDGLAHDFDRCLRTCRDRCVEERADDATHTHYPPVAASSTDDARNVLVLVVIAITIFSALYVVQTSRTSLRTMIRRTTNRVTGARHERFE